MQARTNAEKLMPRSAAISFADSCKFAGIRMVTDTTSPSTRYERSSASLDPFSKSFAYDINITSSCRFALHLLYYCTLAWEQRKFSEVFSFLRNNTLSRADLSESEGYTLNVHYGDILVKFGEVIDAGRDALSRIADDDLAERLSCQSLADGDVIIADTAEDEAVGKCSELRGCGAKPIVSGLHTMACRPMSEFAPGYLGYYMNSPAFHDQLLPLMQGIKVISVSKGAIADTVVRFPSLAEQRAIGRSLTFLDSLITLHQRKPPPARHAPRTWRLAPSLREESPPQERKR